MKSIEPEDRLYPHRPAHDVQNVYSDFSERPKYPLREEERTQAIAFDELLSRGKQLSVERKVDRSETVSKHIMMKEYVQIHLPNPNHMSKWLLKESCAYSEIMAT